MNENHNEDHHENIGTLIKRHVTPLLVEQNITSWNLSEEIEEIVGDGQNRIIELMKEDFNDN